MTLATILARERSRQRLTLRALEALCGVSNATISQIEHGVNAEPSFAKVWAIVTGLGRSLAWLERKLRETPT